MCKSIPDFYFKLCQTWPSSQRYHAMWYKNPHKLKYTCHWILHNLYCSKDTIDHKHTVKDENGNTIKKHEHHDLPKSIQKQIIHDPICVSNLVLLPSLDKETNNGKHQLNQLVKHGSVVIDYSKEYKILETSDPKGYLCTAADLAMKYRMYQYLKHLPLGDAYTIKQLTDIITKKLNVLPEITFLTDPSPDANEKKNHYLNEICLCLDENFKLIDCPPEKNGPDPELKLIYPKCEQLFASDVPKRENKPCSSCPDFVEFKKKIHDILIS